MAARHRQQRPFAQRRREDVGCAEVRGADGFREGGVAAVTVTGKDLRDPPQERDHRCHDARDGEHARCLVGVGAHLLDPLAAQQGTEHGGPRLGGRVIGPGRVPVLPAIDRIGPPLGLDRPSRPRGPPGPARERLTDR
jgi:hypothetical protein